MPKKQSEENFASYEFGDFHIWFVNGMRSADDDVALRVKSERDDSKSSREQLSENNNTKFASSHETDS